MKTLRKICFGVRDTPVQEGFVKYLEAGYVDMKSVDRRLAVDDPMNYFKNKRIASALDAIITENRGNDLLICDDDVYLGHRDYDFERLRYLTYMAIPHGANQGVETVDPAVTQLNIIPSPTCFFLPKDDLYQDRMLRIIRMFNDPDLNANIDVFIDSRWPNSMPKQILFLDGTTHIFNDQQILRLDVKVSGGCFLSPDNRQSTIKQLREAGYWDITLINAQRAVA